MKVAILIVNYDSGTQLHTCLAELDIARPVEVEVEIVVADNASTDGSQNAVEAHPGVRLVQLERNLGFATACNRAAATTDADTLLFVNPDTRLDPAAVLALAQTLAKEPRLGAVGPRIVGPEGWSEPSWDRDLSIVTEWRRRRLWRRLRAGSAAAIATAERRAAHVRDVDWLTGACLAVTRSAFEEIGGFDEAFFLYFEDADLGRRLRRAGHRLRFQPQTVVRHQRGGSGGTVDDEQRRRWYRDSQRRYYRQHRGPLQRLLLGLYLGLSR